MPEAATQTGLDSWLTSPIVIKVGTNVVTRPHEGSNRPRLDVNLMRDLAGEISAIMELTGRRVILVSSGAVAAGREVITLDSEIERTTGGKQALASVGQPRLMREYEQAFLMAKPQRVTSQMLLTAHDFQRQDGRRNILNMLRVLPRETVTVVNENDTVATEELNLGDNDQLAAQMAILVQARVLILLTDTDGVFDKNPKEHKDGKLINELPLEQLTESFIECCKSGGKSSNGTGGMASKLKAAKTVSEKNIEVFIANGKKAGILSSIIEKEQGGTRIKKAA